MAGGRACERGERGTWEMNGICAQGRDIQPTRLRKKVKFQVESEGKSWKD